LRQASLFRLIPLHNRAGDLVAVALVDDADYERVSGHQWHLCRRKEDGQMCARRVVNEAGVKRTVFLHRFVLDAPDGMQVDHINHNQLDDRRANLRLATPSQNSQNRRGARADSSTGIRGVSWHKRDKRYYARVKVAGKNIHLGSFVDPAEADRAAAAGRARYMTHAAECQGAEMAS
jgi:hypothetical protein